MIRLLLVAAIAALLGLAIWRYRAGKLQFRVSTWPLGQQIEMTLAGLAALAALLGVAASEFNFATWIGLVSVTLAAMALFSWPDQKP